MITHAIRWLSLSLIFFHILPVLAGQPLLSMIPITPIPPTIPNNGTIVTVIYNVVNNTKNSSLTQFSMTPIPGVEQVSNTTGACNASTTSDSCLLYLVFHGDHTPAAINNGPIINTGSSRTRPSANQILQMQTAAPSNQVNNTWIKVLIEQDPAPSASGTPPNDLATYVAKVKKLAPNLEQFHLRVTPFPVTPGAPIYQQYADTITAVRAAYPGTALIIGFHPDNNSSEASCVDWGCDADSCALPPNQWTTTQLTCMLNASIQTMNMITALLPAGQGFDTFSIEQGYVEPMATCPLSPSPPQPPACLQQIKACLCPQGTQTQNGTACPSVNLESCLTGVTLASPSVTYGNVLGSYGGEDIYGPTKLDFGYPQYYNLGKQIAPDYDALISEGYFPSTSTACHQTPYPPHLVVVDVDTPGAYSPEIPCPISGQPDVANIYTNPSASAPNVTLASNYFAFLLTQYPPIQQTVDTHGAQVFLALSGEPNFLGAPGWSLTNIFQFNYNLGINLLYLQKLYPTLFPYGIPPIQYAIWNFGSILEHMSAD